MSTTIPYVNAPLGELTDAQVLGLASRLVPEVGPPKAIEIRGACPRCGDYVHYVIHLREFAPDGDGDGGSGSNRLKLLGIAPVEPSLPAPEPVPIPLNCNCAEPHEPAAKGKGGPGCGAWFAVDVTVIDQTVTLSSSSLQLSLAEEQNAQARDKLVTTELQRFRSAAGNWKTGLAALFALIPALVVVKGTDTVQNLPDTDKIIVGGLIAFGAALAVIATLLSLRAAYGPLRREHLLGHKPVIPGFDEIEKTAFYIQLARLLAIVAVLALAAAIAYVWASPTSKPYISLDLVGGAGYCGTLVSLDAKAVVVSTADGRTSIPTGKVKSTTFVASC